MYLARGGDPLRSPRGPLRGAFCLRQDFGISDVNDRSGFNKSHYDLGYLSRLIRGARVPVPLLFSLLFEIRTTSNEEQFQNHCEFFLNPWPRRGLAESEIDDIIYPHHFQ